MVKTNKNQSGVWLRRENISFKEYISLWYEDIYSPRVCQSTRTVSEYMLNNVIMPAIDVNIPLRSVTVEYLNDLMARCALHSRTAGNSVRGLLGIAFKDAITNGYITRNPLPDTKTYPRQKPNVRILREDDLKKLIHAAGKNEWYLEILLAVFCGLRKGEILGLKYEDVDFERSTIHVRRQAGYHNGDIPLKTENSDRVLHIHRVVMKEIELRRELTEKRKMDISAMFQDQGYISCQKNGACHSPSAMNNALSKLCKRNGIPVITVHGLRHQYATILLEQGVSIERISALLGHASISTTYDYYLEVMGAEAEIMEYMNATYRDLEGGMNED